MAGDVAETGQANVCARGCGRVSSDGITRDDEKSCGAEQVEGSKGGTKRKKQEALILQISFLRGGYKQLSSKQ